MMSRMPGESANGVEKIAPSGKLVSTELTFVRSIASVYGERKYVRALDGGERGPEWWSSDLRGGTYAIACVERHAGDE